jgi:hypothetical protein
MLRRDHSPNVWRKILRPRAFAYESSKQKVLITAVIVLCLSASSFLNVHPSRSLAVLDALSFVAQVKERTAPPVKRIDHIMIRSDVPGKLYAFFTETLQLPVAWPLARRGAVTSGGVGFGNTSVEAIQFPGQKPSHAQLVGFGFEPSPLSDCLAELDRRGITYGEPRPFVVTEQDGTKKTLFTNVTLRQFSDAERPADATMHIFLSEYNPSYVNVDQRRKRLRRELRENQGGPLGVQAVNEVIIKVTDFESAARLWTTLLGRPTAPGLWRIGDGPAIRIVQAGENQLQGLVFSVSSLRQAKAFLRHKGLLGAVSEEVVTIDAAKLLGLNIRLVETASNRSVNKRRR